MEVNFLSNSTKVKQMAEAIRLAISQGEFKEGEMLPSINQISARYNVARDTAFKAFQDLKASGVIESAPTKGYYVASSVNNIMVMLDIFSPYKNDLYNALTRNISPNNRLDLYFHHYNAEHFNTVIKNSIGRYNKYLVMNLYNDQFSEVLSLIDKSKLLLLDFGKFEKSSYAYVCQGFDTTLYDCLKSGAHLFKKYRKLNFMFPANSEHPRGGIHYFHRFCAENNLRSELREHSVMEADIVPGEAYLIVSHADLIEAIKICRTKGLKLGEDVGIVTFNDAPMLEIIDNGITTISTDFQQMGIQAARFINHNERVQVYIPTRLIIRGSL
ncbi:MAG: HTH-type transcriptional regulator FrlR [Bacteroidetes bacterium ADurb.Bin416]|jgi:DNA-binding transcriptional regulator YhcF (GntR family)|nr:MAG: HTH-type transcriptional regulator FrlR [Bacteroidetes bacterium ADurb.Bin416]